MNTEKTTEAAFGESRLTDELGDIQCELEDAIKSAIDKPEGATMCELDAVIRSVLDRHAHTLTKKCCAGGTQLD